MNQKDPLQKIEQYTRDTHDFMSKKSKGVFEKYPLIFASLVLCGVVSTALGFEMMIANLSLFQNNPFLLFLTGVCILVFTGSLYKIIERHK